jgi:hypothetical protein
MLRSPLCRAPAVFGTRAPVAQLDRAPDYESGGRRFESFRARHFRLTAEPMRKPLFLAILSLSACTSPGGPYPSLRPRAAEAIDPRVEPARPINGRPVAPALAAQLGALVAQARAGDTAFGPAAAQAEQLASSAGPAQSEGWIAAQEALTAAIAARRPTALAQADVDALAATALQTKGGIAPNDLEAIQNAAAEVAVVARRQTDRIAAIQKRLGV